MSTNTKTLQNVSKSDASMTQTVRKKERAQSTIRVHRKIEGDTQLTVLLVVLDVSYYLLLNFFFIFKKQQGKSTKSRFKDKKIGGKVAFE